MYAYVYNIYNLLIYSTFLKIILYIRNLTNSISAAFFKEPRIVQDVVDWEFLLLVARKQNIKEKMGRMF